MIRVAIHRPLAQDCARLSIRIWDSLGLGSHVIDAIPLDWSLGAGTNIHTNKRGLGLVDHLRLAMLSVTGGTIYDRGTDLGGIVQRQHEAARKGHCEPTPTRRLCRVTLEVPMTEMPGREPLAQGNGCGWQPVPAWPWSGEVSSRCSAKDKIVLLK